MNCQCKRESLRENMRLVWLQHVYWTRLLIISITERLGDNQVTETRLLQNPKDIADIFAMFYPCKVADSIENLLTEHLHIGGELITALRDCENEKAAALDREWYINADKMAKKFSNINPCYDYCVIKKMLFMHLDLIKKEVNARLGNRYNEDVATFAKIEMEAIMMADNFTAGIAKQCGLCR